MDDTGFLEKQFQASRAHLRRVAFRMLGSTSDAEDAVQEAWIRLSRADASDVHNLAGWLTTVTARVCLDMLRTRTSRREEPLPEARAQISDGNPEDDVLLAESMGPALLVVLETLAPAERVAFVLHDLFGLSFDEIAPIVERTPAAARQLASRARRRVHGGAPTTTDVARQREVVGAFLAASREGNFEALLAVLDPDVVLRADELAVRTAAALKSAYAPTLAREIRGARAVAETCNGRARGATPALVDGMPGAAWIVGGNTRAAFRFTVAHDKVVAIELVMDPQVLELLDIESAPKSEPRD
jgi:RNA polymerase sigma-70 factor (ECF subfamily)